MDLPVLAHILTSELAGSTLVEIIDLAEYKEQSQAGQRRKYRYRFDV